VYISQPQTNRHAGMGLFFNWRRLMKTTMTLILAALLGMFTLTGCNTVEGFGKDLKKAGGQLEEAAAK
jgi:entericidin A